MRPIIRLAESQNHRCGYCGLPMVQHPHVNGQTTSPNIPTKDHIEPRTYGGETTYENMIAACLQCNNMRGELDAIAFYHLILKWFKRDPLLRARWHRLDRQTFSRLKSKCYEVHERQLRGLAIRSKEHAFRHHSFTVSRQRISEPRSL